MPPMKIIGMPTMAPIPVRARMAPTIIFNKPTAFLVGFQNSGARRRKNIISSAGSIEYAKKGFNITTELVLQCSMRDQFFLLGACAVLTLRIYFCKIDALGWADTAWHRYETYLKAIGPSSPAPTESNDTW